MIIALFPNEKKQDSFDLAQGIVEFLNSKKVIVVADDDKAESIGAKKLSTIDPKKIHFLISMGGDGTILRLSHRFKDIEAPLLGINLGHLGFMADIPITDIFPSLQDLIDGNYDIHKRLILEGTDQEKNTYLAMNDFVFHRGGNHSLVEIAIHVDGVYLNTFLADGIIFATPNGSTAYSLAAGGPILHPEMDDTVVLTPICPHTISNRPFVFSSNHTIQIQYLSEFESIDMYADGVESCKLKTGESFILKNANKRFQLVNLHRHEYFSTLRTKLGWSGKLH